MVDVGARARNNEKLILYLPWICWNCEAMAAFRSAISNPSAGLLDHLWGPMHRRSSTSRKRIMAMQSKILIKTPLGATILVLTTALISKAVQKQDPFHALCAASLAHTCGPCGVRCIQITCGMAPQLCRVDLTDQSASMSGTRKLMLTDLEDPETIGQWTNCHVCRVMSDARGWKGIISNSCWAPKMEGHERESWIWSHLQHTVTTSYLVPIKMVILPRIYIILLYTFVIFGVFEGSGIGMYFLDRTLPYI